MTEPEALAWCKANKAIVTFGVGFCEVVFWNGAERYERNAPTFAEAVGLIKGIDDDLRRARWQEECDELP